MIKQGKSGFTIFWLVGENSGDLHASIVMKSINDDLPNVRHVGIGGGRMQSEGLIPLFPFERFNVMGFVDVVAQLSFFLNVERGLKRYFKREKPDLAILVDYPGLNLRIANMADNMRIDVLYYICPQFWAWKHERVFKLRASVRHVACILPFEKDLLDIHNVACTYVGHPIAEEIKIDLSREQFAEFYSLDTGKTWLGFLPGSRDSEVKRMLPVFLQTAKKLEQEHFEILISKAQTVSHSLYMDILARYPLANAHIIDGYRYEMMRYSELLVSTSGTATLEAAYIGTPLIIGYKTAPINYFIGRKLVRIKRIGLPNIILDMDLLPELLQDEFNPENIVAKVNELIDDKPKMQAIRSELTRLHDMMADRQASVEMLKIVRKMLGLDE